MSAVLGLVALITLLWIDDAEWPAHTVVVEQPANPPFEAKVGQNSPQLTKKDAQKELSTWPLSMTHSVERGCAVRLAVVGVGAAAESEALAALPDACAASAVDADLVWDISARAVIDSFGRRVMDVDDTATVALAIQRLTLERALIDATDGTPLVADVHNPTGMLAEGSQMNVSVEAPHAGYVQLLNLTPDGRLLRLYPLYEGDRYTPLEAGERLELGELQPEPPYGRESVWLIVSEAPLPFALERFDVMAGEVDAAGYLRWLQHQKDAGTLAVRRFDVSTVSNRSEPSP
ncbi:DUF4384 domain-containing protein [Polycyclovorans algicola]|uniref:DUF4384 domain-containing protein n=1 Tax=Polycyclovorans algicola TaxID=616992 RepID=UPI001268FC62|nr:DUF4384 domain-containing protein [Polycyclovorans algicola]